MLKRKDIIELIANGQPLQEQKEAAVLILQGFNDDEIIKIFNKNTIGLKLSQTYNIGEGKVFVIEFQELTQKFVTKMNIENNIPESILSKSEIKYRLLHNIDL